MIIMLGAQAIGAELAPEASPAISSVTAAARAAEEAVLIIIIITTIVIIMIVSIREQLGSSCC